MTKPIARHPIYLRRRFDAEIIELCVRWYITYRLSYRDLVAMMAERGIVVSHTTIHRWVIRYVPEFEKRWNRFARPVNRSWRVDETYIKIRAPLVNRSQYSIDVFVRLLENTPWLKTSRRFRASEF
jgi:transposase-like protein